MNRVLLIVPPFAMTNFPSLAAHSLQAVGRKAGFDVSVFYANISFEALLGETYGKLCNGGPELPGESVFAAAAWSLPVTGKTEEEKKLDFSQVFYPPSDPPPAAEMKDLSLQAENWIESLKEQIKTWDYSLVGLTSSYEQTNASVAIMKAVKAVHPRTITFMGGYNAEGVMAEGIASADRGGKIIDYIFSGESELTFAAFLEQWRLGELPGERIIRGQAVENLDDLPLLDYDEYFDQSGGAGDTTQLALESSRGCWWGEKSHCLFCGYADDRIRFREKSQERVLTELEHMEKYPSRYGHMADLIMPKAHFDGIIPRLKEKDSSWTLYYEQRAAWNRGQLESMEQAGIRDNQPGIETLSSNILSLMGKGTNLKNNLTFLREATGAGNRLYWNFVWGFPGEKGEEYRAMTELIPKICHLIPPMGIFRLALARFSPLFENPDKWGVSNIRPLPAYKRVFPGHSDFEKLANYFICDYDAETFDNPSIMEAFTAAVDRWNEGWSSPLTRPRLMAARSGTGELILLDTRIPGQAVKREIEEVKLKALLNNSPLDGSPEQSEALEQNLALAIKNDFVPLITIETPLRKELLDD